MSCLYFPFKGMLGLCWNTTVTLIKRKIKFSTHIRKFRRERLQSHLWLMASSYKTKYLRIFSYIRKPFLILWLRNRSYLNFLKYEENFLFFFISVDYGWTYRVPLHSNVIYQQIHCHPQRTFPLPSSNLSVSWLYLLIYTLTQRHSDIFGNFLNFLRGLEFAWAST